MAQILQWTVWLSWSQTPFLSAFGCQFVSRIKFTELGRRHSFRVVYADITYTVVQFVLPFLILTVFSVLLIRVYRAQRRRRAAMCMSRGSRHNASTTSTTSVSVSDEHSVTRVIVVVMLVFAVCNLPAKVLDIAYMASPDCGSAAYIARRLSFVLEMANSTANFVVYCALRHQFRDGLRRALTPLQPQSHCRRQQTDDGPTQRSLRQHARRSAPADLELIQIVDELPHSHLNVPGVVPDRNSTCVSMTLHHD